MQCAFTYGPTIVRIGNPIKDPFPSYQTCIALGCVGIGWVGSEILSFLRSLDWVEPVGLYCNMMLEVQLGWSVNNGPMAVCSRLILSDCSQL